jgi:hypothetical protein
MSKLTQSDLPVIVARGDSFARVYRIEAAPSDIGYDLGTGDTLEAFVPTATGQGVPPIPGFNAEDAETWPTIEELAAHFASLIPTAETILATRKAQLRAIAKARRSELIAAGFSYLGKTIQTRDLVDVSNVEAAALKATNDAGYSTYWITGDNSLLALDAAGIIGMQGAMVDAGNAIFAAYIATTSAIEAAADLAAVEALAESAATFTP